MQNTFDPALLDYDATRTRSAKGRAAAATANPLASRAALRMLQLGGSAIDAAVAAQAVLTAVEPNASGIGGGAVILVAMGRDVHAIEGLSAAPGRVTDRLDRDFDGRVVPSERAAFGGRTIGVPGVLRALEEAHARFGKLPWATLFEPAIELAEDGYAMSGYLLRALRENPANQTDALPRALFCGEDGLPLAAGTPIRNPDLARTLRLIATGGADAFYTGEIAAGICQAVAADPWPGTITMQDLARYRAVPRAPARFALGEMQVAAGCLPSFGGTAVGQVIGIAAAHGVTRLGRDMSADEIHILAEAGRLAYADRAAYAGDPDYERLDTQSWLDPHYLHRRAQLIDPHRRTDALSRGSEDGGSMTSHIAIADESGQVVSMTTTINNNFGGRVTTGGFYLNNVLTNFSMPPKQGGRSNVNMLAPNRRARTSIAPCIVCNEMGQPVAAVGAGGGNRIIGTVANALLRFAGGMTDPQAIIASPQALNSGGQTEMEPPLDRHAAELAQRGHWVLPRRLDGGTQMIIHTEDGWSAGGDPRRDGVGMALI